MAAVLSLTDAARAMIVDVRDQQDEAAELAFLIRVAGVNGADFAYEMGFVRRDQLRHDDAVHDDGGLLVATPADSVALLEGAVLSTSRDLLNPGLQIENPNRPSPRILNPDAAPPDPDASLEDQVRQVIDVHINPAIAMHGGTAELVAVEGPTAYVRLGGGCQGCGMASVTLSQGIEAAILTTVPAITSVVDVTDHASGTNPYYEQAKK